jgi:hypothetical protein
MLRPHRSVLYLGRSGSGKSEAMRGILRHVNVDLAAAFCPTDETCAELAKIIPPSLIHPRLDVQVVQSALQMQKEDAHREPTLALIFDDTGFSRKDWASNTMREAIMNARHHRTALHFSMQYIKSIDPSIRSNVSYIVACAENIHANKRALWQCFFGIIPTYQEFDTLFTACTRDYSCIVLDQTQPSASIENSIFWFRADVNAPPFRMCKPVFWTLHRKVKPPVEENQVIEC